MSKRTYTLSWQFLKARCECGPGDDDCWLWKQALTRQGHPQMTYAGEKAVRAARVMYELFYGKKPGAALVRSCGEKRCMNPAHLLSRTRSQAAKLNHELGRSGSSAKKRLAMMANPPRAKLSWEEVRKLRAEISGGMKGKDAADKYGLSPSAVSQIRLQKTWREGILA